MKRTASFISQAILNSYAILFFSQNKVFGFLLMAVSFVNFDAGLAGSLSVLFSLAIVSLVGYHRESTRMGFYSFNALLLGIGMGTFYELNAAFFIWLAVACLAVTMLSVTLAAWLGKANFPLLSFPFVVVFWLVLLSANSVFHMGLQQSNSAIINELFTAGERNGYHLFGFIAVPEYCALFFRALSAVLFQNNVITGILISIGLLIHSRIHFSLLVLAFVVACLFNNITGTYPDGISYYHLGSNIMMTAGAIGCFFLVPSWRSYLWAFVSIPVTFLVINSLTRLCGIYDLPVLSLPFAVTTIAFLAFFKLRVNAGKLQLTPIQHYSPERNLYQYLNNSERLRELNYLNLQLPVMGTWTVSQGYDGDITHKADWGKALDLVIKDEDGNTYQYPGTQVSHFYCFNKPVLACADGVVEEVVSHIEDNDIGGVNTVDNWGNSIVIKHAVGLYSKVSHLKKDSAKVKVGDAVKQGNILAMCGNSGRSPEPHLHFQAQATPYIGSKTIAYPFAYYLNNSDPQNKLHSFDTPAEGDEISNIETDTSLKQAFNLQPGYTANVSAGDRHERFEVFTDAYNLSYLYSESTGATTYFINNGTAFYFTSFYGDRRSLLYQFYLAAYKVVFTTDAAITINDIYPVQVTGDRATLWLHDLLAPFHQFIKLKYQGQNEANGPRINIYAGQYKNGEQVMDARITIEGGHIQGFAVETGNKKTDAKWVEEN